MANVVSPTAPTRSTRFSDANVDESVAARGVRSDDVTTTPNNLKAPLGSSSSSSSSSKFELLEAAARQSVVKEALSKAGAEAEAGGGETMNWHDCVLAAMGEQKPRKRARCTRQELCEAVLREGATVEDGAALVRFVQERARNVRTRGPEAEETALKTGRWRLATAAAAAAKSGAGGAGGSAAERGEDGGSTAAAHGVAAAAEAQRG